jgi:hypothetical protein
MQPLGGPPEMQFLGDGDEVPEMTKLHTEQCPARVAVCRRVGGGFFL